MVKGKRGSKMKKIYKQRSRPSQASLILNCAKYCGVKRDLFIYETFKGQLKALNMHPAGYQKCVKVLSKILCV